MLLKRFKNNEDDDKNRYLISYADLITLLLGLFVILYSSSQVDGAKYKEFTQAFKEVFDQNGEGVLDGGLGVLNGNPKPIPHPLNGKVDKNLEEISEIAKSSLNFLLKDGKLILRNENNLLTLELPEELLFETAKAEVKSEGLKVLDTIVSALGQINNLITIDGHTDTDPIKTFRYASNWHLSVARASNVAYSMIGFGLMEENLSIRGYGSQRPLNNNSSFSEKARNRRVEITISEMSELTPSTLGYKPEIDSIKKE